MTLPAHDPGPSGADRDPPAPADPAGWAGAAAAAADPLEPVAGTRGSLDSAAGPAAPEWSTGGTARGAGIGSVEATPGGSEGGPRGASSGGAPWHGRLWLRFEASAAGSVHQGGATAPLRLQRGFRQGDGRCELPILHTAGGLVGGDRLSLEMALEAGSSALLTSVAAQKVYGTVGRSRRDPAGLWAHQDLQMRVAEGADLEWLPQELVLYADGLYSQRMRVHLSPGASWLGAEVVRLGRTAAGESLGRGRWRSSLEVVRRWPEMSRWELVDRIELGDAALHGEHGLAGQPVFGSLVWAAPEPLPADDLAALLAAGRSARAGLEGEMGCGALEQGLVARYRGPSTTAARSWFTRLWAAIRSARGLPAPELPRCWPFQEQPLAFEPLPSERPEEWPVARGRA